MSPSWTASSHCVTIRRTTPLQDAVHPRREGGTLFNSRRVLQDGDYRSCAGPGPEMGLTRSCSPARLEGRCDHAAAVPGRSMYHSPTGRETFVEQLQRQLTVWSLGGGLFTIWRPVQRGKVRGFRRRRASYARLLAPDGDLHNHVSELATEGF